MDNSIVVICGHEGIEHIFWTGTREATLELATKLKNHAINLKMADDLMLKRMYLEGEDPPEEKDVVKWYYKSEQVCVRKPVEPYGRFECVCSKDFPELPKLEKPWLMG